MEQLFHLRPINIILQLLIIIHKLYSKVINLIWEETIMIRFNKITEYGIRVIRTMYQVDGQTISSVKISQQENISLPMLMKVLRKLKQVGYIRSSRGRGDSCGGYTLAIDPKGLTLKDVVVALEGEIYVSDCLCNNLPGKGKVDGRIHHEMGVLNNIIVQELSRKSLYEMIS